MRFEVCEGGWILTARQSVSKDESTTEDVVSFMVMGSEVLTLRKESAQDDARRVKDEMLRPYPASYTQNTSY
jgi:hypothetical protein